VQGGLGRIWRKRPLTGGLGKMWLWTYSSTVPKGKKVEVFLCTIIFNRNNQTKCKNASHECHAVNQNMGLVSL
jgi:hypothetical protein